MLWCNVDRDWGALYAPCTEFWAEYTDRDNLLNVKNDIAMCSAVQLRQQPWKQLRASLGAYLSSFDLIQDFLDRLQHNFGYVSLLFSGGA
jgi:hypothetical protein